MSPAKKPPGPGAILLRARQSGLRTFSGMKAGMYEAVCGRREGGSRFAVLAGDRTPRGWRGTGAKAVEPRGGLPPQPNESLRTLGNRGFFRIGQGDCPGHPRLFVTGGPFAIQGGGGGRWDWPGRTKAPGGMDGKNFGSQPRDPIPDLGSREKRPPHWGLPGERLTAG